MLDLLQHAPLVVGVFDLLHLDHLLLLQDLDGIEARVVLGLHEVHPAKGPRAERALQREVAQGILALGDARHGMVGPPVVHGRGGTGAVSLAGAGVGGLRGPRGLRRRLVRGLLLVGSRLYGCIFGFRRRSWVGGGLARVALVQGRGGLGRGGGDRLLPRR